MVKPEKTNLYPILFIKIEHFHYSMTRSSMHWDDNNEAKL